MSMLLMVRAMTCKLGNPARKLVLIKLADNANDDGECFPSYQYIADCCEISKRSAIEHVKQLEVDGYLEIIPRFTGNKNRSNVYKLHFPVDNLSTPSADSAPSGADSAPLDGADSAPITSHSFNQSLKTHARKENNKFIKPSVNEIADYCKKIDSKVDAIVFYDFYEKKHWVVGRVVMTDWQEAVRYWDNGKKTKELTNLPSNDDDLESWASKVGLSKANAGESFPQYRARLYRDFEQQKMNVKGVNHG